MCCCCCWHAFATLCCNHKPRKLSVAAAPPGARLQVKYKIMRNIGLAFVHMGQYQDALQTFATVMDTMPDHQVRCNGH
jgi:hypothetical protein